MVVSAQHSAEVKIDALRDAILEQVIFPVLPEQLLDERTEYFINPTGRFVVGGPAGDSGLTGRKIIADTYGGAARHGGGAFSGKDPSKVDRTGAYMARYLAKNIVAAELAERCEIELAYAIGLADPVSVMVETFGTGRVSDEALADWLMKNVDMRPGGITARFELRRPIYRRVSCGGHFGENAAGLPWEWTDLAEVLQKEILCCAETARLYGAHLWAGAAACRADAAHHKCPAERCGRGADGVCLSAAFCPMVGYHGGLVRAGAIPRGDLFLPVSAECDRFPLRGKPLTQRL